MDMNGNSTITISTEHIPDLSPDTTVARFKQAIVDKEGAQVADVRLIYAGKQLSKNDNTLKDYNIHNESTLFGVLRLLGGAQAAGKVYQFDKEKVEKLKQIKIGDDLVNVTVKPEDANCQICYTKKPVAILHDNHEVCATCMANQARAKVFNGDPAINCPISCQKEIPPQVAFTVAGLNEDEWKEWEMQINKNALCFKSCPKCGQFVMKEIKEQRVRCPKCKAYDFCWSCLNKWKGADNIHCGNPTCNCIADALRLLEESWNEREKPWDEEEQKGGKEISGIKHVPSIRVCPNPGCLRVNEHHKNCKHIKCEGMTGCRHQYCHVCLKKWEKCKCGYCQFLGDKIETCSLGKKCQVHPLQKLQ